MSETVAMDGSAPSGYMVELREVVKIYEGGIRALDGVDLALSAGEFVAITGPSGCGKSTLLHLVAALDTPTSGDVIFDGKDLRTIRDLSRFRREEVGLIFQLHNLLPQVSVVANIEVVMFGTHRSARQRRARAMELVGEMDLSGRAERLPTRLSGGERQRVAIARALANEPRLLLADEPTGNLDSAAAAEVAGLLEHLHRSGKTVVLITHEADVAAQARRTVRLRDGAIVDTTAAGVP